LAWLAQFGQTAAELNQTELSRAMTALHMSTSTTGTH
jgi:hypothetical protein